MAEDSTQSGADCTRATVVYSSFDESHELHNDVVDSFIKIGSENGYANVCNGRQSHAQATPARSFIAPPRPSSFSPQRRRPPSGSGWQSIYESLLAQDDHAATASADLLLNSAADWRRDVRCSADRTETTETTKRKKPSIGP